MRPSELKYQVEQHGNEPYFFKRDTMKFWGDTMRNYGVRSATIKVNYDPQDNYIKDGCTVEVWELYRKRPVKHGLQDSAYFDKVHFKELFPKRSE